MEDSKATTFFNLLQEEKDLDLRDERGKVHDIALILTEVVIALLCKRDGKLSSLWRHMNNHHTEVVMELGMDSEIPKKRYPALTYPYC